MSPTDLLKHLVTRGIRITDGVRAVHALEQIGYYRLLPYMRSLQAPDGVTGARHFIVGTTFEDVLARYDFDRKLRILCMDAVERIEVALRAAIIRNVAVKHGAHFYLESRHFAVPSGPADFQAEIRKEETRHPALKHYRNTYDHPAMPPIWAAMEAVSFGTLSHLFSNLALPLRKEVALGFGYDETVLQSWFRALSTLRNIAAHHGRLWNARLHVNQPLQAKVLKPVFGPDPRTFYSRAVVIAALLDNIALSPDWKRKLLKLLDTHRHLETGMGFPPGWRALAFWTPAPARPNRAKQPIRRFPGTKRSTQP